VSHAIWLVRHASTEWTGVRWCGRRDLSLNAAGCAEAIGLADRLAPSLLGATFVSSPLTRARQTTAVLADRLGRPVTVDDDLVEVDFGAAEGLTFDEIAAAWPPLAESLLAGRVDVDWPGGERAADLVARVTRAWSRLVALAAARPVVAVSHGGVIGLVRRLFVNGPTFGPGAFAVPASAVQLVPDGDEWVIAA
jgi:probable phosphoglycerate mutase